MVRGIKIGVVVLVAMAFSATAFSATSKKVDNKKKVTKSSKAKTSTSVSSKSKSSTAKTKISAKDVKPKSFLDNFGFKYLNYTATAVSPNAASFGQASAPINYFQASYKVKDLGTLFARHYFSFSYDDVGKSYKNSDPMLGLSRSFGTLFGKKIGGSIRVRPSTNLLEGNNSGLLARVGGSAATSWSWAGNKKTGKTKEARDIASSSKKKNKKWWEKASTGYYALGYHYLYGEQPTKDRTDLYLLHYVYSSIPINKVVTLAPFDLFYVQKFTNNDSFYKLYSELAGVESGVDFSVNKNFFIGFDFSYAFNPRKRGFALFKPENTSLAVSSIVNF